MNYADSSREGQGQHDGLAKLRAKACERAPDQEHHLLEYAAAMVSVGLRRDEIEWELAEAHWPEDGSRPAPDGGEPAHADLMARLRAHVAAEMSAAICDVARGTLSKYAACEEATGEIPSWEAERLAETLAWTADIRSAATTVRALKAAAEHTNLHLSADAQRAALRAARRASREWWSGRNWHFTDEAEADRARAGAWESAFGTACDLFADGQVLPAVASELAVLLPDLDAEGVADAVVAAARARETPLNEGAYLAAQEAAKAARSVIGGMSVATGNVDTYAAEIAGVVAADAEDAMRRLAAWRGRRISRAPLGPSFLIKKPGLAVGPDGELPRSPHSCPREIEFDLQTEPGLLGDLARWFDQRAYRPVREFNMPAVLATGAALFGRRLATPTALGLNLYAIATADTTGGKDALVSGPEAILSACGLRHLKGPGDFASDAAIEKAIRARPCHLMAIDEFGKVAQAMYGRNAPHFVKLAAKSFLALYPLSAPDREWSGKERATDERDSASDVVFSPTLTVLGVSTPEGLFEGVPDSVLNDGTLNRFTLFVAGKPGPRQRDPARLQVPTDLVTRVRAAYSNSGVPGDMTEAGYRTAGLKPALRCVPWADALAEEAFIAIEDWQDAADERGLKGIAGRAGEQSIKIATIRAAFRDSKEPAVTADDIAWAFAIVHRSIRELEAGVRANMANNEFGIVLNAIQRAIVGAGAKGISRTDLLKASGVRHADERFVKTALERLQATEVIYAPTMRPGRGGKLGARYFARFEGD